MQCDNCGKRDAVIQLTQVENNEMKILHLCDSCASERGVETAAQKTNAPLVDFLAQIGQGPEEPKVTGACPSCGLSLAQLRQTGRLGCGVCYTHFHQHLGSLLRRLHGATRHVGKVVLPSEPDEHDMNARMSSLRRSLERAVEAEDFEHAATLRDELRRLETSDP